MKTNSLVLFLMFIWSFLAIAQTDSCTFSISGKVMDAETKEPIPYVTVQVSGTEKYGLTNQKGNFFIDGLCSDTNTLIVSCIGYSNTTEEHHHEHGEQPHFYLTQKVLGLNQVTVQAEKKKEKGTETISQVKINKAALASNPTQSLAAVLSEQQGVTFTSAGTNVQLPVIHGLHGNRILILNNGLKHGFQNWGSEHAPEIDIASANNITIVKGAAGVRFGPEALGGAIIVESNPLHLEEPFYIDAGTGFQTNGRGYNANLELGKGSSNFSYFLNGNYTRIGDRKAPDYNLTNTGKEEIAFSFGTLYHLKNLDVKLYYSFVDQNLALLRSSVAESGNAFTRAINANEPIIINPFSYDINQPNQLIQHHLGKVELNWWYANEGKLTLRAGKQLNKREEFDVRRNSELPIIDLDLVTTDYQLEWKHPDWKGLDGLIGIQFFGQDNDNNPGTNTTPFIPNYNTERYSAFIIESLKFGKNTLEAGVRLDYESNTIAGREINQDIFRDEYDFTNLTASIGYVSQLSDNVTYRTNFGTAWRTPNIAELFSFGQNRFSLNYGLLRYGFNTAGEISTNEVIRLDESAVEPEVGYKFINEFQIYKDTNTHTISAYTNYINNYVFDRPFGVLGTFSGPTPAFIFDQTDALFIGADYSWQKDWSTQVSGTFGFSYLWSRNISDNEVLIEQPPIALNYKLEWKHRKFWEFEASKLMIRPSYTFRQFQAPRTIPTESLIDGSVPLELNSEIFDFIAAPDGYFLLDIGWSFKWKDFNASITVNNLLNTSYRNYLNDLRYFADEPGRNILFSLNYSFKAKKNETL